MRDAYLNLWAFCAHPVHKTHDGIFPFSYLIHPAFTPFLTMKHLRLPKTLRTNDRKCCVRVLSILDLSTEYTQYALGTFCRSLCHLGGGNVPPGPEPVILGCHSVLS